MVGEPAPQEVVVALAGELDMATSPRLGETVVEILDRGPVRVITIDLSELGFLDSSGMRALLQARNAAARHGAEFAVRRPSEHVGKVLRIAALDQVLNIDETGSAPSA